MQLKTIHNVSQLVDVLNDLKEVQSIFRGVSSEDYELKPAIGRLPLLDGQTRDQLESRLFASLKNALFHTWFLCLGMNGNGSQPRSIMEFPPDF